MLLELGPMMRTQQRSPKPLKPPRLMPDAHTRAVLLELGPMTRDGALRLNPAVLLANALAAFALNLVRPMLVPCAERSAGTRQPAPLAWCAACVPAQICGGDTR